MVRHLPLALAIAAGLSACAGDMNPVRDILVATGAGAEPKPAPDFISQSRPTELDYRPTGVAPPPRALKSKTAAEVAKMEADMDALKTSNEARASSARRAGATSAPAAPNSQ